MSGILGYAFGFEDGRSSAEGSRRNREIVDQVIYGQRLVQVDRSYLDQLTSAIASLRAASDHNLGKAQMFHSEALEWKADAERHETNATALQAQVAALQAQVAKYDAAFVQRRADHHKTNAEKYGLDYLRWIATGLIRAHIQGRGDWPEFLELRDLANTVSESILRGEPFLGFEDGPHEKARIRTLVDALGRP